MISRQAAFAYTQVQSHVWFATFPARVSGVICADSVVCISSGAVTHSSLFAVRSCPVNACFHVQERFVAHYQPNWGALPPHPSTLFALPVDIGEAQLANQPSQARCHNQIETAYHVCVCERERGSKSLRGERNGGPHSYSKCQAAVHLPNQFPLPARSDISGSDRLSRCNAFEMPRPSGLLIPKHPS